MAMINAPDYAKDPAEIIISGSLGRAVIQGNDVQFDFWDGRRDHWPDKKEGRTSMDVAVNEIVTALDSGAPISSPGEEGLRDLEIILGCHASYARNAAWTNLPLVGDDRNRVLQSG